MPAFRYKAVAANGGAVTGTLEAESRALALRRLVRTGLQPLEIAEAVAAGDAVRLPDKKPGEIDETQPVKLKRADLIQFTEELSDMLEAGLPLEPALRSLSNRGGNMRLAAVSKRLRNSVMEGASFGAALRNASPNFDELYCSLATAGEASGALPSILKRQAKFLAQLAELRSKVISSMIYPALLMTVAAGVGVLFLTVLLPDLSGLLKESGSQMPAGARFILWLSEFLQRWWWAMLLGIAAVVYAAWHWTHDEKNRPAWDSMKLRLPGVGGLLRTSMQVQFLETLANLVSNGLPLLRGLELTRNTFSNVFVRSRLDVCCSAVADGTSFSRALQRSAVFPAELVDMVTVGESTGDLPEALMHAARRFDRELSLRIQRITALIQPVIIIAVALLVGTMVYLVISAIFQSFASFGNVRR